MTADATTRFARRPGRTTGAANLGAALAVIVVLLPLLLHAATAAPPTAAEFSPNARQVIKKTQADQAAAVNGTGAAKAGPGKGTGPGGGSPSPSPSPPSLVVAAGQLKQCVGPPPLRQIEDPQSPPCIAYWAGDNGGATARGVTRDSIYIAVPTPNGYTQQYTALQNFFNKRFQLYGRKVVFEFCSPAAGASSQGSGDQTNQDSDASQAAHGCANKPVPFASTFYQFDNGRYYNQQMACRYRIITVSSYSPFDSSYENACSPYLYQYPMQSQDEFAQLGDWACSRLVGHDAEWAAGSTAPGKPALNTTPRTFGVFLAPYYHDDPVARRSVLRALTDRLKACGAPVPDSRAIINPVDETSTPGQSLDPVSASNAIAQMKQANVSTIFCLCGLFPFGALARAASADSYTPEWIGSTYGLLDAYGALTVSAAPQNEMQRLFGLTFVPRQVNPLLEPLNAAFQEGDPTLAPATSSGDIGYFTQIYRPLLMLLSGIQMAGPHLTPETFLAGLRSTTFPNPATPLNAGHVGVGPSDHSFTQDAAEWWYDPSAKGPYSDDAAAKGAICYLLGGARHVLGAFPRGEPAYFPANHACDSGA